MEKEQERLKELEALIGQPPGGSHPDEWRPRAETWHKERENWVAEVETLRRRLMEKEQVRDGTMGDQETQEIAYSRLVDLFGPFSKDGGYEVVVEGRAVPFLRAFQRGDAMFKDRPIVSLQLDDRMVIDDVTIDELQRWGWLMANAMAISAGYTCFGPNARRSNPFRVEESQVR